jgi:hypothetical protein
MEVLRDQAGVIARRQALEAGLTSHDVRRLLRRRAWVAVHPGVYVDHTGPLTWLQRAWAGVLHAWPAALCGESALRAVEGPGRREDSTIRVAIAADRKIVDRPGLRVQRMVHLDERTLWNLGPPRLRYEEAVLDVALEAPSDLAAVGVVAQACGGRRTTSARLARALAARERSSRRRFLGGVLVDVAEGACSVLEHAFLVNVERAHGLPRGERQHRVTATLGVVYRDVTYEDDLDLELDGRLHHDSVEQRDRDLDRDLDSAVANRLAVRLGYGQVVDRACVTAGRIAMLLRSRGWTGTPKPCGPDCDLRGIWVSLGDTQIPPTGQPAA